MSRLSITVFLLYNVWSICLFKYRTSYIILILWQVEQQDFFHIAGGHQDSAPRHMGRHGFNKCSCVESPGLKQPGKFMLTGGQFVHTRSAMCARDYCNYDRTHSVHCAQSMHCIFIMSLIWKTCKAYELHISECIASFECTVEAPLKDTLVSGQLYLRPPSQNPILLNSHTNSVLSLSPKQPVPVTTQHSFGAQGCLLTRALTVLNA